MPPMASSPRILNRQAPSDAEAMQKAPVAVQHRSACSGLKALRNTSHAKAASRQALLAFRSLDPFRALRQFIIFIIAPRAQASRRCETQATLRRQAAKLC